MPTNIRTFVINLKRSPHRRAHMEEQLRALNISHEIVDATDGSTLTEKELESLYNKEASLRHIDQVITKNEIACADSHLRIYERIVNENIPYSLILEDDVTLDPRIKEILSPTFLSSQSFDWLQIDYARVGWPFFRLWLLASWHNIKKHPAFILYALLKIPFIIILSIFEWLRQKSSNRVRIVSFARPLYLASAYIVTNVGAKKLIAAGRPIRFAADMLPNKARLTSDLAMKATCPPLAYQDKKFDSDIGVR